MYKNIKSRWADTRNYFPSRWGESIVVLLIAALGAALSLCVTGYVFGISNNLFHLPIIASLYDEPQFQNDAFIQSLRYFASGPWMILAGSDRYVDGPRLFLGLLYLSRFISFVGFLMCAELLGVRTLLERSIFVVLLCFIKLMQGTSAAGGGGLFINHFTHSEVANGLTMLTLYFAVRGRVTATFSMNGIVFFFNAFVAVWNAAPIAVILLAQLRRGEVTVRDALKNGALGIAVFLVIASPVLSNIWFNPEFGMSLNFDYRVYLEQYWPFHTLFWFNPFTEKLWLIVVVTVGTLSFIALGKSANLFQAALWSYVVVYLFGIVAPLLTNSPTVLNLNLLRSSTCLHLLASLGAISLATIWVAGVEQIRSRVLGPLLVLSVSTLKLATIFAIPLIAISFAPGVVRRVYRIRLDYAAIVMLIVIWPLVVWSSARRNAVLAEGIPEWKEIGHWARANTSPDAVFLIPYQETDSVIFQYASHRRIWVDKKRGAAVMWMPSYYATWWPRVSEVSRLTSLSEMSLYASQNGISYIADVCNPAESQERLVFRTAHFCVFSVARTATRGLP
jgi:hypothetical protein